MSESLNMRLKVTSVPLILLLHSSRLQMEQGSEPDVPKSVKRWILRYRGRSRYGQVLPFGVGRMHNVAPKDIVGAIAGETGIPGKAIGAIRILDTYSFVEIPREHAQEVYTIMKERTIRNQPTGIEPASGKRA